MKPLVLIAIIGALSLCSCYTNFNQTFLHKEYDGYLIEIPRKSLDTKDGSDLTAEMDEDRRAPSRTLIPEKDALPSVLYRCGQDWYVAGVRCKVSARDRHFHFINEPPMEGVRFKMKPLPGSPVYYHKITADSAQRICSTRLTDAPTEIVDLLELQSDTTSDRRARKIDKKVMKLWTKWMKTHGVELEPNSEWISALPKGAVAVPAPLLELYGYSKQDAKFVSVSGDTHNYILSGITTVVLDVPCSVATTAAFTAVAVVVLYLKNNR